MTGHVSRGGRRINVRRRVPGLSAAAALAAAGALVLTACGGSDDETEPTPSGSGQQAVNEGAGIPTKAFTVVQSKDRVLTADEFPGSTQKYREQRVGAQRLNVGQSLGEVSGLDQECASQLRAMNRKSVSVLSGAEASATLPEEASGTDSAGTVRITIYTTRSGESPADVLSSFSDTCSGTLEEPDSISPVQRGLSGVAVVQGSEHVTVAAGDWGANHLLVETDGVDAEVAQQIIDAQLAKLSAPEG